MHPNEDISEENSEKFPICQFQGLKKYEKINSFKHVSLKTFLHFRKRLENGWNLAYMIKQAPLEQVFDPFSVLRI